MKKIIGFFLLFQSLPILANSLPFHDYEILLDSDIETENFQKEDIDLIINKIKLEFQKDFKLKNQNLVINNEWDDPMVNALAYQNLPNAHIDLMGGMAKHKLMTKRAMKNILCHELGHHLGGDPLKTVEEASWMSAEAQSDYFATYECLRRINQGDDISQNSIPPFLKQKCNERFSTDKERNICIESIMGAKEMTSLFYAILSENPYSNSSIVEPQLDKRESFAIQNILTDDYPNLQCRLDTMVEGALCDEACKKMQLQPNLVIAPYSGFRPSCWFNQKDFLRKPQAKTCKSNDKKLNCTFYLTSLFNGTDRSLKLTGDCGKKYGSTDDENLDLFALTNKISARGLSTKNFEYVLTINYDQSSPKLINGTLEMAVKPSTEFNNKFINVPINCN
jgi:hypothetical protein